MKKLLAIVLAAMMVLSLAACNGESSNAEYVIGMCQIEPHPALDAATKGFMDAVKAGLGADKVEFIDKNAAGDSNTLNTIINDYVSRNVDLILANSTPVLQTAAQATATIPILGTSVTEYGVALDIDDFDGLVGGNISGTSDLAPLTKQADLILEWVPNAQKVGLVYCLAEANSKYQVDVVKAYLESKGLTVAEYGFSSTSDLSAIVTEAANQCDAIYVPTDNTVANSTGMIDSICRDKQVPIIAGEEGICSGCGIATLSISYYDLGYATGEMAVKILKGEANISEMPISYVSEDKLTAKYNAEICEDLGITPKDGYVAIEKN